MSSLPQTQAAFRAMATVLATSVIVNGADGVAAFAGRASSVFTARMDVGLRTFKVA